MQPILRPIEQVVDLLENVVINEAAIQTFADNIDLSALQGSEFNVDTLLKNAPPEDYMALAFIYDAINFSYWGNPKWTTQVNGTNYDGSAAMLRALREGVSDGLALLNPHYLATLNHETFTMLLKGNIQIPLFEDRLKFLNQLGRHIASKYNGSFTNFIDDAGWNAEAITLKLARELPEVFDDTATYKDHRIHFYKRAQLISAHLYDLHRLDVTTQPLLGFDKLTAFADYKVPQLMRRLGILAYKPELAHKVDNLIELPKDSNEELEIRIATIWANELCTQVAKKRLPQVTAAQVDGLFWFAGQKTNPTIKPYHRTRTVWY
jgi:hypothetical protein